MEAGYRGTTAEQDSRWSDKQKKLLKQMKFEACLDTKVNLAKVNLDVVKPWITVKLNTILGIEDDVIVEYVFTQLEEKSLNPKIMQINLTGFLNARRSREFMGELWSLLIEAQNSEDGIPASLITKKMEELKASAEGRREVPMARATENDWRNRYQSLTGGRYGKSAPNYASEPGAGDELNRGPDSPTTNRRYQRERTPEDLPRRGARTQDLRDDRRGDRRDDRRGDRRGGGDREDERRGGGDRRGSGDVKRSKHKRRSRSRSPTRSPARSRSRSPGRRHRHHHRRSKRDRSPRSPRSRSPRSPVSPRSPRSPRPARSSRSPRPPRSPRSPRSPQSPRRPPRSPRTPSRSPKRRHKHSRKHRH